MAVAARPAVSRAAGSRSEPAARRPTTICEKLSVLVDDFELTASELSRAIGCSTRAIEDRKRRNHSGKPPARGRRTSRVDEGVDALYAVAAMMHDKYAVDYRLVRAFVTGRSPYLEEQSPADLLAEGYFEMVRDAAIAFSRGRTPAEFIATSGPFPRVLMR